MENTTKNFKNEQGGGKKDSNNNYKKEELPEGYLSGGYFKIADGEKVLRPEYIVKYPKKIAVGLSGISSKNKRSQVRKYYQYILRIQGLLRRKNNNFPSVEAELDRLLPFVKYAESRGTVSPLFRNFIEKNIMIINNGEDLNAFVKHFEAVVAYLPREKN